jgi:hypothetical protein
MASRSSSITPLVAGLVDEVDREVGYLAQEDVTGGVVGVYHGPAALELVHFVGDDGSAATLAVDAFDYGRVVADEAFANRGVLFERGCGIGLIMRCGVEEFMAGRAVGFAGFTGLGADGANGRFLVAVAGFGGGGHGYWVWRGELSWLF